MLPGDIDQHPVSLNASWATIWLQVLSTNASGRYSHSLLLENFATRPTVIAYIKAYVSNAHDDAIKRLRKIEGVSLKPDEITDDGQDPAKNYPQALTINTLMGYFGEILAALVCENFQPLGLSGWKVPAFLFRHHLEAFRYLEKIRQDEKLADLEESIWGRTGDDCVAFILGDDGCIHKTLICEAKCYSQYAEKAASEAFKKLNQELLSSFAL